MNWSAMWGTFALCFSISTIISGYFAMDGLSSRYSDAANRVGLFILSFLAFSMSAAFCALNWGHA